jgi:hypothetical protein
LRVTVQTATPPRSLGRLPVAAARYAALGLAAIALAAVHLKHRPSTICIFRATTGLPCPLCGGTTAAVNLGHADLGGALRASPVAVGLLALGPLAGLLHPPRWWANHRTRWLVIAGVLIVSELWQLVRFGIISV